MIFFACRESDTKEGTSMELQVKSADRNLLLEISGELDHHGARNALREVEQAIDAALPKKLVMDLSGVTFMDSSGIGLVMGRYQVMKNIGGRVSLQNTPVHIRKVMRLAGLDRYATIN